MDFTSEMGARSSSESSMVSSSYGDSTVGDFDEDTEYLIRNEHKTPLRYDNYKRNIVLKFHLLKCTLTNLRMWDHMKRRSSYQVLPTFEQKKVFRELHHPLFQNIRIIQVCCSFRIFRKFHIIVQFLYNRSMTIKLV